MPTWGNSTADGAGTDTFSSGTARAVRGTFPNVSGATLQSVSIHMRRASASLTRRARIAIYTGGTSDTDPSGATLLEDLGVLNVPDDTMQVRTINSTTAPTIPANTRVWIAMKNGFSGLTMLSGNTRTTELNTGYKSLTTGLANTDDQVGWESTLGTITGGVTASELAVFLTYTTGGGGGNAPRSMFFHLQGMR